MGNGAIELENNVCSRLNKDEKRTEACPLLSVPSEKKLKQSFHIYLAKDVMQATCDS